MESPIPETLTFPVFFSAFCVTYFIGYFLVFRGWSPKHRPDAASCFISLFHGTPAVALAAVALLSQPSQSRGFSAANTPFQTLVLDFSIAYFTVDLLHYLVLLPSGYLFIAHHLATLFVFVTCRYFVFHGAFTILVLLVLAELTSLCQNVWTLAGLRRDEFKIADKVYRLLSPPFYALYTLMRVVFGPLFFYKMSAFHLSSEAGDVMPRWLSVSWIGVVGMAIAVSILWISNLWIELYRERYQSVEKKEN